MGYILGFGILVVGLLGGYLIAKITVMTPKSVISVSKVPDEVLILREVSTMVEGIAESIGKSVAAALGVNVNPVVLQEMEPLEDAVFTPPHEQDDLFSWLARGEEITPSLENEDG